MSKPGPNAVLLILAAVMLAIIPAGCALVTCRPASIVVAEKDDRAHVEIVPAGLRTTGTGRLEEAEEFRLVRTYWVRSEEGHWYSVSATDFQAIRIGDPIKVCR